MQFKVLFIHQDALITGSAISLLYMIKGLKSADYLAEVLFLKSGPAIELFEKNGVKTYKVIGHGYWTAPGPKWRELGTFHNIKALLPNLKLRSTILKITPNLIHINDKAALTAGISCIFSGIPVVQHLRSTYYLTSWIGHTLISKLAISVYSDRYIAISEDEADGFSKKKMNIIFNSIDMKYANEALGNRNKTREDYNMLDTSLHIGWVGKIGYSKGVWDFLNLAGRLILVHPEIKMHFHLIAKLPDENAKEITKTKFGKKGIEFIQKKLIRHIDENRLGDHLTLHGYKKNYLNMMGAMDIMVNCNRLGAFGRQAFEAISVGTPCVATHKYPGKSSVLKHMETAMICKEGDQKGLFEAVEKLILDSVLRKKLAKHGIQYSRINFDQILQAKKVEAVYDKLLNKS